MGCYTLKMILYIYFRLFYFIQTNNNASNCSYQVTFSMNMVSMRCIYWKSVTWSSEGMEVDVNSSIDGNLQCNTYHFSLFSSSIFVSPNLVHPLHEIYLFSNIANNLVCLILVIIIFIIYFLLLYWSSIRDVHDIIMVRI